MDQLNTFEDRKNDRLDTKDKLETVVSQGTSIIAGSNLVIEDTPIGEHEVEIMRSLINVTFPSSSDEDVKSKTHLALAGRFAHKFGDALKATGNPAYADLNSDLLEIAALGHDLGRSITHRALRHDIAGDMVLTQLGMRKDIVAAMPSALAHTKITRRFLHEFRSHHPNASPEELQRALKSLAQQTLVDSSIEERIVLISDICGKPGDGLKGIRTFEGVMDYHRTTRGNYEKASGRKILFPSDRHIDPDVIDFTEHLYRLHKDWLASEGVDVEEIRKGILEDEEKVHKSIQSNPDNSI